MKRIIHLLFAGAALSASSQAALPPTTPVLQTTPQPPLIPSFPALPMLPGQPGLTNAPTTSGFSVPALSEQLTNLQNDLQQVLPALANFNDGFDFFSTPGGQGVGATNGTGQSIPVGTGAVLAPGGMAGTTNNTGALPGFASFPLNRETLRALLILQNDLERMLPLLNALNTGSSLPSIGLNPVMFPAGFTNIFGGVANTNFMTGSTNGP